MPRLPKKTTIDKPPFYHPLTARTPNQKAYIRAIIENDIVICSGPAGCGKSLCSIGLAVQHLVEGKIKRIIVTRPIVEAGESLGALPGSAEEKQGPYLAPIYDAILKFVSNTQLKTWLNDKSIEPIPLAYLRGRSLDNAIIIGDEMQNATLPQLKMFLTRIGQNSKMVINGDLQQSDLPKHTQGGLDFCIKRLKSLAGIAIIQLGEEDIVRHPLIYPIIKALETP